MEKDLKVVRNKWSVKSEAIEKILQCALNKRVTKLEKKYKLWTTEQVLQWIQYKTRDKVIFEPKDVETLKIRNIAGINIYKMDHDILEDIGVEKEWHQSLIITSVHNLIAKYDKEMDIW